ncbi:MAG: hypothetical protein ACOYNC_18900 [Bacteroidales bacterium]
MEKEGDSYYQSRNCYTIPLGNGVITRWSNFEDAESFLAKTNVKLNYKVVTINQILIETYSHYRKIWFYMTNLPDHVAMDYQIKNALDGIDKNFEMATTRGHFENGNHFVFKHLFGILDYLIDILTILQKVERHHKKYAEINMLEVFKERVEYARQDLKTIGNGQGNVKIRTGHGTLG